MSCSKIDYSFDDVREWFEGDKHVSELPGALPEHTMARDLQAGATAGGAHASPLQQLASVLRERGQRLDQESDEANEGDEARDPEHPRELASPPSCAYTYALLQAQAGGSTTEWAEWISGNWRWFDRQLEPALATRKAEELRVEGRGEGGSGAVLAASRILRLPSPPLHLHSRFRPEAPWRSGCPSLPVVDGKQYYDLVAYLFKAARRSIYISGWYFSHHVYLRRDPLRDRLDQLLASKAAEGVQVHVLLWSEVEVARNMSYGKSSYNKQVLEAMHPNIHVVVHPEIAHLMQGVSAGVLDDMAWSHH